MRRFGVRALACSLAAAMVMTGFTAPAVARAENDLLIAPAPVSAKTLYITADMVDSDGEVVISGEEWDRIVIAKEAESKNIYLDQVKVGELVVESGCTSNVQLWEVKADTVTVKEPELSELTLSDLKSLLADPLTQQTAVDLYMKNMEQNLKTQQKAPSIITMEEAEVGEVAVHGNVTLDLAQGKVENLAVQASEKQERVTITVKNYDGSVSYEGGAALSITNLKLVDSKVTSLKVEESAANNYLNVRNKDSVAAKVEVAGNAQVSLNVPTGELNVTEAASAANVAVLNAVDEMKVAADNAKIEVAPIGNVASATVDGDHVNIGGAGVLEEVNINGKDAYVSTDGTDVEGENTYVKPVYVAPKVEIKNIDLTGADGAEVTKNANGSSTVAFAGVYKTATFQIPANVDVDRISSVVLNITADAQFCVKLVSKTGGEIKTDYPGYSISGATTDEYIYSYSPAQHKLGKIEFMSLDNTRELTVNSIVFNLLDKAPEAEPTPTPAPASAPADGTECSTDSYVVHNFTEYDLRDYAGTTVQISVDMTKRGGSTDATAHVQLNDSGFAGIAWSQAITDDWKTFSYSYDVPASFASQANPVYFGFRKVGDADYSEFTFYYKDFKFTGTPAAGGEDPTPTDKPEVTVTIAKPEKTELAIGETLPLQATASVSGSAITWTSSNEAIAKVNETGLVTAVSGGAVTITAACGEAKDTVELTVKASEEEKITEFYLVKDVAFTDKLVKATDYGTAVDVGECSLNGNNFANKLPESMKADSAVVDKFKTLTGILEMVDSFEVELTLTKGIAVEGKESYAPQAQVFLQSSDWSKGTFGQVIANMGEPSEGAPKKGVINHPTDLCAEWTSPTLGKIGIQMLNAEADTVVSGSYSIKVVLKK